MFKCKFNNIQELKSFLEESDYGEVKFCVNPDYVDAIIGISDEGKIVYDYDKMVQHLATIYQKEQDCTDPYTDAIEWIDYNCQIPYWEIVFTDETYPPIYEDINGFEEAFADYTKYIIGPNTYGTLLIDSEYITDNIIDNVESILKKYELDYKII